MGAATSEASRSHIGRLLASMKAPMAAAVPGAGSDMGHYRPRAGLRKMRRDAGERLLTDDGGSRMM